MLPSARRAYVESLSAEDAEWFMRTLCKLPPTNSRDDWEGYIKGADQVMSDIFDIFLNPEAYASAKKLRDPKAESRRELANAILKSTAEKRKRLLSLWCEMRVLKNKALVEKMRDNISDTRIAGIEGVVLQLVSKRNKTQQGQSAAGKKGARAARALRMQTPDKEREAVVAHAKRLLKERNDDGLHEGKSNNALFLMASNAHIGASGKPILSADAIKKAIQRGKNERRGKYDRTGKPRGRYKKRA